MKNGILILIKTSHFDAAIGIFLHQKETLCTDSGLANAITAYREKAKAIWNQWERHVGDLKMQIFEMKNMYFGLQGKNFNPFR